MYFFITIPVSQSITHRESPPQVATKRLPPPQPAHTGNRTHFKQQNYTCPFTVGTFIYKKKKKIMDAFKKKKKNFILKRKGSSVPEASGSGWKAQAHSCVEKSSELFCLLWHWSTWSGCRPTGCCWKEIQQSDDNPTLPTDGY